MQGVFHAGFFLFHFDFGGSAHLDHCHTAGQLGHALLQFFTVVVAGGFFDLHTHLLDAGFDVVRSTGAVDDDGVFFAHFDALGGTQVSQSHFFQGQADFFSDHLAAGQDGDVFQHGFATVTKARGFDGDHFQDATDGVHDQSCQGFAFDVFGNDQQRTASLGDLLQRGQQVTDVADFLVVQEHERVVQQSGLLLRIVDEVGRQVAAVKLHAFDDVEFVVQRFAVFHGDHAFFADFVHGLGDDVTNAGVAVGRNRTHLGDFFGRGGGLGGFFQLGDQGVNRLVDTALQIHGVHACGHVFHAFVHDGLCQHGCGSGAVARVVRGLRSHFLDHLRAHVLQLVFEFDFLGHGHTVLGHGGGAERALQHHVTAFRA